MVTISNAFHIQTVAGPKGQPAREFGAILESLLPVKFGSSNGNGNGPAAGAILIEGEEQGASEDRSPAISTFKVPPADVSATAEELIELTVKFADDADVPFPFRARSIKTKVAAGAETLVVSGSEKVLAESGQGPVWVMSEKQGTKHFRSGFPLPVIPAGGSLQDVLHGDRFLELLPLLQWLREICGSNRYKAPALRACFIIDDPNLHWPRYGFVDYKEMAEQAAKENYHVSFATIPLDGWFTNKKAVSLFKNNPDRLSLSIHGNDHVRLELGRSYTEAARMALLTQSIQRIERLERNTGLQVSRIMVPPHGACSDEMLGDLPRTGFESASISHGSLRAHNKNRPWTKTLGYAPVELIHGCPVMPRWALNMNENIVLLAAYLGQALILRGHHGDLKPGIEVLNQHARFINSLGNVSWSNLTGVSRLNYQSRVADGIVRIKPLGRKFVVPVAIGAKSLIVESVYNGLFGNWQISGANVGNLTARTGERVNLPESFAGNIQVELVSAPPTRAEKALRRPVATAFIRRLMTESRDRFLTR